jgi:hypothetical protein
MVEREKFGLNLINTFEKYLKNEKSDDINEIKSSFKNFCDLISQNSQQNTRKKLLFDFLKFLKENRYFINFIIK